MRFLCLLLLVVSFSAQATHIDYFYDGDTVKINDNGQTFKLRITDIDAPERNQTYGLKSRRALMKLCTRADIRYQISGVDKYQRKVGKLQCNQQDVSLYMVQNGHAWFADHFSSDYTLYLAQKEAQQAKLGLWQDSKPSPPWLWRKNHAHVTTK
ncbi:MAG TPA: thermonuclease family protein [Methylophilus sp.]|nr:thermonuclease family protein [Methylophilus sp.]HQQ33539.1 thermonuclease family protein [Methylophilus sp.]